ncbi:hypothetical protein ACTWJ8_36370 [Streptomyces sp. SDT5-1]|uniref:hypothetical protein n=1 Tax=Streptomyces sp. SDT5-1 TaxID=3406418 RepID=UPI003FD6A3BF
MAPEIVVHRPSPAGGRRVAVAGVILGLAHDDHDLTEFLRRAGLDDAEQLVSGGSALIHWRGGRPHEYGPG